MEERKEEKIGFWQPGISFSVKTGIAGMIFIKINATKPWQQLHWQKGQQGSLSCCC